MMRKFIAVLMIFLMASTVFGIDLTFYWDAPSQPTWDTRVYERTGTPGSYTYTLKGSADADDGLVTVTGITDEDHTYVLKNWNGSLESVDSDAVTYDASESADTTDPTVTITAPTTGATYSTTSATIHTVAGTATDETELDRVVWSNDRGGNGTADGTTAWTIDSIPLSIGSNVITVTAYDTANNDATDSFTVDYTSQTGTLQVKSIKRLSHPNYQLANSGFGTHGTIFSSDNKRFYMFEVREEYTYDGVTKTGRGPVWGWVDDCYDHDCLTEWESQADPLAAYESYAKPIYDGVHIQYQASANWSPLAGEENIIIAPHTSGGNTVIRKTNVDTVDTWTQVVVLTGEATVNCYGFDDDNNLICSELNESWANGGWRINITPGASFGTTTRIETSPLEWYAWDTCNHEPPEIIDAGWEFPEFSLNGHGGKNPGRTYWANNYGGATSPDYGSVIYTTGVIKRSDCSVVADPFKSSTHVTHMSWKSSDSYFIASTCGEECDSGAAAANIDTYKIYQVDFDGSTFTYHELVSQTSAGRWSGHTNFEAIPIATLSSDASKIAFMSTGGKFTIEDYNANNDNEPWGLEGVYMAFTEEEGDVIPPTVTITSPSTASPGALTDTFGAGTAQNILTGGDGAKSNGWYLLNGAQADAIDVNSTNAGKLTINHDGTSTDFEGSTFNGPFVYKLVTGDFDVETYAPKANLTQHWETFNLIARDPAASAGEDYVRVALFWDVDTEIYVSNTVNNSSYGNVYVQEHPYLRMTRVGDVFTVYSKANSGDEWTQRGQWTRSDVADELQVGLGANTFNTEDELVVQFDYFQDNLISDDGTYETSTSPLDTLAGTASDDKGVVSVTWSNVSPYFGNADGTTTWSVLSVPLVPGLNTIIVTAEDAAGNKGSDSIEVTYTGDPDPGPPGNLKTTGVF